MKNAMLIKDKVHRDSRGMFVETWNYKTLKEYGITDKFVQDNYSKSFQKGTLRGMHLQRPPFDQAKLIRCINGKILDIVIDIRINSPNFAKWKSFVLSSKIRTQLYIPTGFLHGFISLTNNVEILYKCSNYYSKKHEVTIKFDDPEFKIKWPLKKYILSQKDKKDAIFFKNFKNPFKYKK